MVLSAPGSLAALAARAVTSTIPIAFGWAPTPSVSSCRQPEPARRQHHRCLLAERAGRAETAGAAARGASERHRIRPVRSTRPTRRTPRIRWKACRRRRARSSSKSTSSTPARKPNSTAYLPNWRSDPVAGLVIANETFYAQRGEQLATLAQKHAVPAVHQSREFAVAGGLMSYGGDTMESPSASRR